MQTQRTVLKNTWLYAVNFYHDVRIATQSDVIMERKTDCPFWSLFL